jgi:hypothetical protein
MVSDLEIFGAAEMIAHSLATAEMRVSPASETELRVRPLSALPDCSGETPVAEIDQIIANWVRCYLMRPHPKLGRPGAVCPFTSAAARLDAIRVGSSQADTQEAVDRTMRQALAAFEAIECPKAQRHLRAVIVGFPNCAGEDGRAVLKNARNRLRLASILGGKMFALFEPRSGDKGLLNPEFRPMQSPLPLLAIRMLVENDAPFVLRNPLLAPIYLLKFPLTGPRKIWSAL